MSYVAVLGILLLVVAVALMTWAMPRDPHRGTHRRA